MVVSQRDKKIFENLFVLEVANNHNGSIDKGLKIIRNYGQLCRQHSIKAAIKLQFRHIESFVHPDFKGSLADKEKALHYIQKTEKKALIKKQYKQLVDCIRGMSCIPMSTPFDESSVDLCVELGMPIIKVASSDINDWPLIEKIASTRLPVIVSTGGATERNLDDVVLFFERRDIPLCINHCVSLYPTEDGQLQLDQIDYLKSRYPSHIIGFSSHEYHDWSNSMMISYGKGARSWERHVDIPWKNQDSPPYNSMPEQIDEWFTAYHKAREMCGGIKDQRRQISDEETNYLDALVRGVYAKTDLDVGTVIHHKNFNDLFYLAIPLQKGQLSCKEMFNGEILTQSVKRDQPITISDVDGLLAENGTLRNRISKRGL